MLYILIALFLLLVCAIIYIFGATTLAPDQADSYYNNQSGDY